MKLIHLLAAASIISGTATTAFAGPHANMRMESPSAAEKVHWEWHHHHRIWVPDHYHDWHR